MRPETPTAPWILTSDTGARWAVVRWVAVPDDNTPVRNYTLQWALDTGDYTLLDSYIAPSLTAFNVTGYKCIAYLSTRD